MIQYVRHWQGAAKNSAIQPKPLKTLALIFIIMYVMRHPAPIPIISEGGEPPWPSCTCAYDHIFIQPHFNSSHTLVVAYGVHCGVPSCRSIAEIAVLCVINRLAGHHPVKGGHIWGVRYGVLVVEVAVVLLDLLCFGCVGGIVWLVSGGSVMALPQAPKLFDDWGAVGDATTVQVDWGLVSASITALEDYEGGKITNTVLSVPLPVDKIWARVGPMEVRPDDD